MKSFEMRMQMDARPAHGEGGLDGDDDDEPGRELVTGRSMPGDLQIERILQQRRERGLALSEAENDKLAASNAVSLGSLSQLLYAPYAPPQEPFAGDPELVVAAAPFGEEAEVFRELRTQLLAKMLARRAKAALAVLSAGPGEGKSYVAANLAAIFGQLGGRTVLIDANLRKPRLHALFGIEDEDGLSSALAGDRRLPPVHQLAQVPGLFFIAAGDVPPNPVELIQSPRFSLLLHDVLSRFDYVIVDTPADSCGADARLVASKSGAVLVVGRKGVSSIPAMQSLVAKIGNGPAEIDGVVLNAGTALRT